MPIGVAALWFVDIDIPTVPRPSSRCSWAQSLQVHSIRDIMLGVENTSSPPLPIAAAVFVLSTTVFSTPFNPTSNISFLLVKLIFFF